MSQPPLPIVTAEQAATTPVQLSGALNTATWTERGLYGGAIVACLPNRFEDCSNFRVIPDHQEVWADADTDQSIIIELNSYDETVADADIAAHYQTELGAANEAFSNDILERGIIADADLPGFGGDVHKSYCLSSQRVSKFKESESLANVVHIYMAVIRLKSVTTDLLVSFNVPTSFAHGSSSDGRAILQADENRAVIQGVLKTLAIKDWGLFGQ